MKKGWTITKLITVGALAVIKFLIWILFGSSVFLATGSIFGGISGLITNPFFTSLVALLVKQFGAVALFGFIDFCFSLPIPSIIPKPINLITGPLRGLLVDFIFLLLRKKGEKLCSFISAMVFNFVLCLELIILYFSVGLPGTQNIPKFLVSAAGLTILTLLFSVIGGLSGYLGFLVYEKLENTSVVKRVQQ